jgi:hypothetical protein
MEINKETKRINQKTKRKDESGASVNLLKDLHLMQIIFRTSCD